MTSSNCTENVSRSGCLLAHWLHACEDQESNLAVAESEWTLWWASIIFRKYLRLAVVTKCLSQMSFTFTKHTQNTDVLPPTPIRVWNVVKASPLTSKAATSQQTFVGMQNCIHQLLPSRHSDSVKFTHCDELIFIFCFLQRRVIRLVMWRLSLAADLAKSWPPRSKEKVRKKDGRRPMYILDPGVRYRQ